MLGYRLVTSVDGTRLRARDNDGRGTPEPRTELERGWFQTHIDQTIESSLMRRYSTLDEQAAAICFLASDEASYITGTVLSVAGGDQGWRAPASDLDADVGHLGVELQPVHAALAADAGLFHAAEGRA